MSPANKSHHIEIVNRPRSVPAGSIKALGTELLERLGSKPSHVTLAFVDDDQMRGLNQQYRGKGSTTDVLSFPMGDEENGRLYLGDIAISTEVAKKQAKSLKHSFLTEVLQLFAHGILHLCGYDHEADNGEMDSLELQLRAEVVDRYCR